MTYRQAFMNWLFSVSGAVWRILAFPERPFPVGMLMGVSVASGSRSYWLIADDDGRNGSGSLLGHSAAADIPMFAVTGFVTAFVVALIAIRPSCND